MLTFVLFFLIWVGATMLLGCIWYIHQQTKQFCDVIAEMQEDIDKERQAFRDERKQLYDRIQAGTLEQYKQYEDEPDKEEKQEEETEVALEDAKEEILNAQ